MQRSEMRRVWLVLTSLWLIAAAAAPQPTTPTEIPDGFFDELEYRFIGPLGNRVIAVTGVPGDANVYYVGAASGGVFKTTDGGAHWQPIFDDQPASSIGALAVAPSDPNVVWAGTGETFIRANISIGNGIYKSTDAGKSWQHMGLDDTGRIGRVIVHPTDPDTVYAAALGHCYGPQPERGVYRTRDGGDTWERVLFVDENTGASDLVMDPTNPRILFAGTWEMSVNTWSRHSGGPGSGLYMSRDGGDSWKKLESDGLPKPPWGKIGLTMSAQDPSRVYALIETSSNRDFAAVDEFQGVLWRSDDGGESWKMVSADNDLVQRPLYYSRAIAAPDDADRVYFMSVRHSTSLDGGVTAAKTESQPGWDHHDMWIDPRLPERMIVGHDGGVSISTNRGESWSRPQLPIAQMYHVAVDRRIPYSVYGNRQDGAAVSGPSNTLDGDDIPLGAWRSVGGCEVGFTIPAEDGVVWSGCYDGILERFDPRTGHARDVSVWPDAVESWPAVDLRYRFQWTFPIAVSPHDPRRVYTGSQFVHRTTDGGQSWAVVSPDLTSDDPQLQQRTGGLTLDDAGPTVAPAIFALAESPLEEGVLWAGTNDGKVQLTRDGGATWTDVTANLPGLPPRGTVSNVEPSRHQPGTCYLTVDRHQLGDTATYVYKTTDYGETWMSLRGDVPQDVFSYAHCVREDPVRPGLLYLGTENALRVSFDDGGRWLPLRSELPPAPVHWMTVQEDFNDLVVATYGRGFWILDDVTPLQHLSAETLASDVALLPPRPAYRFVEREPAMRHPEDPAAGHNPPYGASIHFILGAAADEEAEPEVRMSIRDTDGAVVRTLDDVPSEAGLHRVYWDLRYDETDEVKLRTKPLENPHVPIPDEGWRPLRDGRRIAVLAPPGTYTVQLEVGDLTFIEKLRVLKDPASASSEEELLAQLEAVFELRDMQNRAAAIINEIEWARKQLGDLEARLKDLGRGEEVGAAIHELEAELMELEGHFFGLRLTDARQDTLRWKRLLYARIAHLAASLSRADFAPTDQQLELLQELREELHGHRRRFEELRGDVTAFNELLREKGIGTVILGGE
ncbi:MAG: sialidase [Thermoanaerobaculia bacterium]